MALSEEEVKKSFDRVKEDILQVKRSLNKQTFFIESVQKSLPAALQKDEFYAFIERLGSRVEGLEDRIGSKPGKSEIEKVASDLRAGISSLGRAVDRRDELAEEIRHTRSLRGKVLGLEGSAATKADFSKESARVGAEIASLKFASSSASREVAALSASLARISSDVASLRGKLNSISVASVAKEDISSFTQRIEASVGELSRGFAALRRDFDRRSSEVDSRVSLVASFDGRLGALSGKLAANEGMIASLKNDVLGKSVDRAAFEKSIGELKLQLNQTRQLIDSSMSDVNLDDYVTKRSLKQQLAALSGSVTQFSSRLPEVEDKLNSLRGVSESAQKAAAKIFEKEVRRFEDYSNRSSDDFKRELKRQRELFEERISTLESGQASSRDRLKEEIDYLRNQFKALSKAGAEAKAAMAKISASAEKVAAKTAAELVKEVDEEEKGRGTGKGVSPIIVAIGIVAVLLVGSFFYLSAKGPAPVPATPDEIALPGGLNSGQPIVAPVQNNSFPSEQAKNDSVKQPAAAMNIPPPLAADLNETCREKLECTVRSPGEYRFDCYFDPSLKDCRCFVGTEKECPQDVGEETEVNGTVSEAPVRRSPGIRYYVLAAFVLAVVLFIAYRALPVRKDGDDAEKQHEPGEPKHEKAVKKKPNKAEKNEGKPAPAEEDDDVIDLEEFFEKKEAKKK